LSPGEDQEPAQSLRVANQELPDTILGLVPKSIMWRFMKPFINDTGMKAINAAKYWASARHDGRFRQSHAGFAFLLDYVPNWKFAYKPGGLIQYQSFVPFHSAKQVFSQQLNLAQRYGVIPYLGVFKRHRPDDFLMTHSVDGFSLALDFTITPSNRGRLMSLTAEMDRMVVEAGGRFYFAKDSTLHRTSMTDAVGQERVQSFCRLKTQCDPEELLQTNLYRRLFAGSR
jgi:decaprenylphospho-beta-D-ribofuranose 2-oxidase